MDKVRNTKKELEAVAFRNSRLDKVLNDCIAVMEMPEKWSIDKDGKIIHVYPHPIVAREAYRVNGIQYLPHKSYKLPDVLLERLILLEDAGEEQATKGRHKVKDTELLKWQELRMQGKTCTEIAEIAGVSSSTVSYRLKKLKASKEDVAKEAV